MTRRRPQAMRPRASTRPHIVKIIHPSQNINLADTEKRSG